MSSLTLIFLNHKNLTLFFSALTSQSLKCQERHWGIPFLLPCLQKSLHRDLDKGIKSNTNMVKSSLRQMLLRLTGRRILEEMTYSARKEGSSWSKDSCYSGQEGCWIGNFKKKTWVAVQIPVLYINIGYNINFYCSILMLGGRRWNQDFSKIRKEWWNFKIAIWNYKIAS